MKMILFPQMPPYILLVLNYSVVVIGQNGSLILCAGAPLSPSPLFSVLDKFTVQVEWDAPFTWSAFPIINYTVQVINLTSVEMLASEVFPTDTFSYNVTSTAPPFCNNLEFLVSATNIIGASTGKANGRFPTGIITVKPTHLGPSTLSFVERLPSFGVWSVNTRVLLVCPLLGGLSSLGVSFIGGFTVYSQRYVCGTAPGEFKQTVESSVFFTSQASVHLNITFIVS